MSRPALAQQAAPEKPFFELAERLRAAKDPEQVKRLGDELGRMVVGKNAANRRAETLVNSL